MNSTEDKRLFLLDSYALIYRGYYAFSKGARPNSKGEDTSAIMGFVNTLLDILRKERPSHIAAVFDTSKPTFRHEIFEPYKAQREATPEAISFAVPIIKQILEAFHIPQISVDGFEADDVIGTLAKKAEKNGYTTFMVTPDKDFAQLVSPNIFMYRPARMGNAIEIWGEKEVLRKFDIQNVDQVRDYLGMMGDASDNIPGLPGVGEKTAKKFIAQYGSMESLIENASSISGAMGTKILENKEIGILSKYLATIVTDVPVEFDHQSLHLDRPDMEGVRAIFERLEFRRMMEAVYKDFGYPNGVPVNEQGAPIISAPKSKASAQLDMFSMDQDGQNAFDLFTSMPNISDTTHTYITINTDQELKDLTNKLLEAKEFAFDTETTSLDAVSAELVGVSFSLGKGTGYWIPMPTDRDLIKHKLDIIRPAFEAKASLKIGQNLKYDLQVLSNYGLEVCGEMFDTMVAHYLINPESRHNMDVLAENYLGYKTVAYQDMLGRTKDIRQVEAEKLKEYAVEDADITIQLKEVFAPQLVEKNCQKLFEELEMPLVPVLASMETNGIKIDTGALKELSEDFKAQLRILESNIYAQAGEEFNLNSPKQMGDILFKKLKLSDKPKKTKTGQWSTSEEVLSELSSSHKIVEDILEYRSLQKLLSTYINALPEQINPATGRIHTSFNQTLTATGRLSSSSPNLQNIPIRSTRGKMIRRAFVAADDDHTLLAADYSQIELRIIASLAGEDAMIQAFQNGEDIHRSTAAKVFSINSEDVTKEQRSHAKTVNFGIIYGVSAHGLSRQTDLSRAESADIINAYYATYPKLTQYIESQKEFARQHGYVETIMGRRRYLADINSRNANVRSAAERNAVNAPIQGSAADIIKIAMVNIQNSLIKGKYKTKMLLQVHDELVFDVPKNEVEAVSKIVKTEMETAWVHRVPLVCELGVAQNWLDAH